MNYSIIIPIYKKKKNLLKLIFNLNNHLKKIKVNYEILFIDDNSNDGSFELFKKNKEKYGVYCGKNFKRLIKICSLWIQKLNLTI